MTYTQSSVIKTLFLLIPQIPLNSYKAYEVCSLLSLKIILISGTHFVQFICLFIVI